MAAIHHWDESFSRPVSVSQQIRSSVLAFDRRRIEPLAALRCAVGVAIPLVTALVLGQLGAAVFITVGAVSVGFGSFQGAYRSRAAVMLLASAAMALSVAVAQPTPRAWDTAHVPSDPAPTRKPGPTQTQTNGAYSTDRVRRTFRTTRTTRTARTVRTVRTIRDFLPVRIDDRPIGALTN
jgi:hypothetical protein